MKRILILLLAIFTVEISVAQDCDGWNWPENKAKAEEKYALYTDAKKLGKYKLAAYHLRWILENAPDLNKSTYINGAQIYESLAELEKDPVQKRIYQDSSLLMYDLRIKFCNEKPNVVNRKAFAAYQFFNDKGQEYPMLFDLFKTAFDLNGHNVWDNNLVAYMYITHKHKKSGGDISDEDVIDIYNKITEIIDFKLSQGKNGRIKKYKDNIDKLFAATIDLDCELVENILVPKLKENPEDLDLAKRIFGLALNAKCADSEFFIETAKRVHEKEPNYGMAWLIGNRCLANEEYSCAEKHFIQAIDLTEENDKIADLYYKLATISNQNGDYSGARDYALKAVQADPSRNDAYNLIGNLYMNSYNNCRQGEDKVKDRLVFLAAYEMYKKAGNQNGMDNAKEQFPSVEELFERNYEQGQTMNVGCWINEVVVLKTRD